MSPGRWAPWCVSRIYGLLSQTRSPFSVPAPPHFQALSPKRCVRWLLIEQNKQFNYRKNTLSKNISSLPWLPVSGPASCLPSWRSAQLHPDGAAGLWWSAPCSSSCAPDEHCVLLLLQLLCHHGSISDGLLGFFLSIPALLHCLLNLSLKLRIISLQLLLLIQQTGVLNIDNIDIHIVSSWYVLREGLKFCVSVNMWTDVSYLRMQELNSLTDIQQFLLSQFPSSLSLFHHGSQLIQFSLQQIVAFYPQWRCFLWDHHYCAERHPVAVGHPVKDKFYKWAYCRTFFNFHFFKR